MDWHDEESKLPIELLVKQCFQHLDYLQSNFGDRSSRMGGNSAGSVIVLFSLPFLGSRTEQAEFSRIRFPLGEELISHCRDLSSIKSEVNMEVSDLSFKE